MAQFIYDGNIPHSKKKSHRSNGGKIYGGKLMIFLTIRSIYPNHTNYNKLLLNYGENLWEKLMGKISEKNLLVILYYTSLYILIHPYTSFIKTHKKAF
jgi:hypothetical protein